MTERPFVKFWIVGSAACVSAGWILSAFHQLSLVGYVLFFLVFGTGAAIIRGRRQCPSMAGCNLRRFRRALPFLFLLTAVMAFLGGALHAPNNYDALTYRFPRVLHWWAASGWQWISTPILRMNVSGTVFEWLMMPIFLLTHSDRFFFLINLVSYLLLPGLVFVVFVGGGIARRVAWFWMWLLPTAFCYAMQAGSISNDTIAATYFLSAIHFAWEARRTGDVRNLWLAFLAAGLVTGVKATNLPLLLPIAWVLWPALGLAQKQFFRSVLVLLLSMLISFLPTAALNQHYTGNWGGDPRNSAQVQVKKPLVGILGNSLQLVLQGLEPPFLPAPHATEVWIWKHFPERLRSILKNDFPRFGLGFRELPQEESAGLGIGITIVALISVAAAVLARRRNKMIDRPAAQSRGLVIGLLTWIALFAFMSKLGSESTSRLIAAYYPLLLLPWLLNSTQGFLVRKLWYNALALVAGTIAVLAVGLTPSRPLWPAKCFFDWAAGTYPGNTLIQRARVVYTVYRNRSDLFEELRRNIPDSVPRIGMIADEDDAETSLWRPFGARQVVHVRADDLSRGPGLEWIVVKDDVIEKGDPAGFAPWLQRHGGILVARQAVTEKLGAGPEQWSVLHFAAGAR